MALLYGFFKKFHFPFRKILILFFVIWHNKLLLVLGYYLSRICGKWQKKLNNFSGRLNPWTWCFGLVFGMRRNMFDNICCRTSKNSKFQGKATMRTILNFCVGGIFLVVNQHVKCIFYFLAGKWLRNPELASWQF